MLTVLLFSVSVIHGIYISIQRGEFKLKNFERHNPFSMSALRLSTSLVRAASLADAGYDGVILVTSCAKQVANFDSVKALAGPVNEYLKLHRSALSSASLVAVDKSILPSGRLIISGTGPVSRDYDDVRRYQEAAKAGVRLALKAGLEAPILITVPNQRFPQVELVAALGALLPIYTPLNVREEQNVKKFSKLGILSLGNKESELLHMIEAFESAFTVTRDVGEQGPERMTPPKVAEYVKAAFEGGNVQVEITDDQSIIEKQYPLMAAVNRAANEVKEHQSRLIRLEYNGEGETKDTLFLVGKGVTIDTGGCDLKTGGHMFGMCRDKYGSAVLAGIMKAIEILKPKNVKVVGYMCMVRNSIGERAYTCDEVITSRSGKRIHIYNTDAEGRLTMLDPLTRAKEEALSAVNPHLFTLATLTGHEILSYGYYASIMDNGPAKATGWARDLQATADVYGQPIEISRLHHEDFAFHLAESEQADLRQGNTKPSTQTLRGHQTPAAFLQMASRIDEHGTDSKHPLKFSHIDMGGCSGEHPDTSMPNPVVALVSGLVLPRL